MNSNNGLDKIKQRNSGISILLIFVNIILLIAYYNIGSVSENQKFENPLWILSSLVFLLGGYAFSYHGKTYRLGKWLLVLSIIIFALYYLFYAYINGLASAFRY